MSKRTQLWIGLLVSALCVAAVLLAVDLKEVGQALGKTNWLLTVVAIVVGQILFMLLRAWRWRIMLTGPDEKAPAIGYWPLFHAQNIGYLVTNVLPFRLGDLARAYLVGQAPGMRAEQALSSVVLERVLDLLCIVGFLGVALPFVPAIPEGLSAAGSLFSAAAIAAILLIWLAAANRQRATELARRVLARLGRPQWADHVSSFLDGFASLTRWRLFLPVLVLSIALWLDIVVVYYLGLIPAWPEVSWAAAMLTVCAAAFGISAPSSPGSVGVFHGAVVLGLSVFPLDAEMALSFALVYHATMYVVNLVMGLIGLWQSGQSLGSLMAAVRRQS